MKYDNDTILWMKTGGEVDLPRDPDNWNNLAHRSIRWNPDEKMWEYFIHAVEQDEEIISSRHALENLLRETNRIHQIDDIVTAKRLSPLFELGNRRRCVDRQSN